MQLILPIEFLQKRPNSQSLGLWELGAIKQSLKGSPNGQKQTTSFTFGGQLLNVYQSFGLSILHEGY